MPGSLKTRVYEHIRSRVLSGELTPGMRLANRVLADELGVSVIPVREAISQLSSEGLVEHRPGLGAFVVKLTREDLVDLYDLREALEVHAVRSAAERINVDELDELSSVHDEMRALAVTLAAPELDEEERAEAISRWLETDAAFHAVILRAAGNQRTLRIVRDLRLLSRIFKAHRRIDESAERTRTCDEHERLLDTLRRHAPDEAADVLRAHIRKGCQLVLDAHARSRMEE